MTLQEQLDYALAQEDYEQACILRDQIASGVPPSADEFVRQHSLETMKELQRRYDKMLADALYNTKKYPPYPGWWSITYFTP
jgi:hypothetical protein